MAIQTNASSKTIVNVRYSAFLASMYLLSQEAAINQAKALVGESEVKKGFQGNNGDSASAKAHAHLREQGVTLPSAITGTLTSASVQERETEGGRTTPYLNVGITDGDERVYISVDLNTDVAQMLARKLVEAKFGEPTELKMFATFEPGKSDSSRSFANHGVSLRQNGAEVKGVNPKTDLTPRIDTAFKALTDAGMSRDKDKEIFQKKRDLIQLEYHTELMAIVKANADVHYANRNATTAAPSEEAKAA